MVLVGASVLGWFVLWSLEAQLDGSHVVWSCLSLLGAVYLCWVLFIVIGRSLVGAAVLVLYACTAVYLCLVMLQNYIY